MYNEFFSTFNINDKASSLIRRVLMQVGNGYTGILGVCTVQA